MKSIFTSEMGDLLEAEPENGEYKKYIPRFLDLLKLRCDDPVKKLSEVFDALARNRDADVSALFWGEAKP